MLYMYTTERVYGVQFARIGLPKWSLRPVFTALNALSSSSTDSLSESDSYYWVTAGWGTSPTPCQFTYKYVLRTVTLYTK
jgi:hypothetical protein